MLHMWGKEVYKIAEKPLDNLRRFGCVVYKMIPEEQRLNKKFGERSRRCMMVAYINGTTKQWRIWQQEDNLKQDVSLQLPMSSSMKKSINLRPACVTTTHGSHPYRYSRARYQALYELKKPQAAQVWKRLEHDYLYKFSKNVHDLREKLWSIKLEDCESVEKYSYTIQSTIEKYNRCASRIEVYCYSHLPSSAHS